MRFTLDNETYDTQDMLSLDVDSIYLHLYLFPARGLAFVQTFDDQRGVVIRKAPELLAAALLKRQIETGSSDISSYQDLYDPLITPKRRAAMRPTPPTPPPRPAGMSDAPAKPPAPAEPATPSQPV